MAEEIEVEVAYARPDLQRIYAVKVRVGMTVNDAISHSGVLTDFPEIELARCKVGIFSKVADLEQRLRAHDRVEIYRPLLADPKEVRKRRAARGLPTKTPQ